MPGATSPTETAYSGVRADGAWIGRDGLPPVPPEGATARAMTHMGSYGRVTGQFAPKGDSRCVITGLRRRIMQGASDDPSPGAASARTLGSLRGPIGTLTGSADAALAAFEDAVRNHSRTFWSVAAAVLGRREGAEDVVQEAVVVALGKRNEFGKVENFIAWMAQIVRFTALNRRRSAKMRLAEGEEALKQVASPGAVNVGSADPALLVNSKGELLAGEKAFDDNVLRALDTLDETPRACLLLRILNDLSYKEIGQVLEIPEGTAMSHVFRARRAMLERLGPVTRSSATGERERHA